MERARRARSSPVQDSRAHASRPAPFEPADFHYGPPSDNDPRFGEYSTHELGIEPDAYDPKLDVDLTLLREGDLNVVGLDRAAWCRVRPRAGEAASSPVRAGRLLYRAGCARGDDAGAESSGGLDGD
ncbi:hypothetical protein E6W39_00140 [Kitasatospora acidiphila]|uniref:Uncharacterized protein n=1 Tax=Kitasatospora acidiphila TaxID=2567942 RepID=A0A540WGC9_9ACTN|nr:hypothetical protein [Kitasatospora acidiphila]TQF08008.1 hypothetical protein E6W39_00140 [Kitasatospora acidiphila]